MAVLGFACDTKSIEFGPMRFIAGSLLVASARHQKSHSIETALQRDERCGQEEIGWIQSVVVAGIMTLRAAQKHLGCTTSWTAPPTHVPTAVPTVYSPFHCSLKELQWIKKKVETGWMSKAHAQRQAGCLTGWSGDSRNNW